MAWILLRPSNYKQVAPLVRTGGSRHTGLAALPHRNIQTRIMPIPFNTSSHDKRSALLCSQDCVISQLFVNMKVYLLIPTLDKIILISFFKYSFGSIFFIAKSKPFSKFSKKNILDDGILDGYSN